MTAVAGLGLITVNALAQERERDERREGERRERTERDSDRERPRGERSRSGERSERGSRGGSERKEVCQFESRESAEEIGAESETRARKRGDWEQKSGTERERLVELI